jgi:hypothetical protein
MLQRSEEGNGSSCNRLLLFFFFFFLLKRYSATSCRGLLPLILLPCNEANATNDEDDGNYRRLRFLVLLRCNAVEEAAFFL